MGKDMHHKELFHNNTLKASIPLRETQGTQNEGVDWDDVGVLLLS
jgi:hypothetical protein